jgi:large subunit ribosomal protein L6
MSRIGKMPVVLPKGVSLKVATASVEVKGPKGTLTSPLPPGISCKVEEGRAVISRSTEAKRERAFHGLARALLANAVKGVSEGFNRQIELQGIGYKAAVQGKKLELALGFSHPVVYPIPEGVAIAVDTKAGRISVTGTDKQQVGQVAAEIRGLKPPEPYKGKGIRYVGEQIKKKVGKTGA